MQPTGFLVEYLIIGSITLLWVLPGRALVPDLEITKEVLLLLAPALYGVGMFIDAVSHYLTIGFDRRVRSDNGRVRSRGFRLTNDMRSLPVHVKRVAALAALLFTFIGTVGAADDAVPLIVMDHVPLSDAIRNLARHSSLNYILDPRVPGSSFGPGRLVPEPSVYARWTNATGRAALSALLKEHQLVLVPNPVTTVARIGPANLGIKPVSSDRVGTDTNPVVALVVMDSVSLTDAIRRLAGMAHLNILLDPKVSAPEFDRQGTVSVRWQQITARQALAALLDNSGLVMSEDPGKAIARISLKPTNDEASQQP